MYHRGKELVGVLSWEGVGRCTIVNLYGYYINIGGGGVSEPPAVDWKGECVSFGAEFGFL